MIQHDGEPAFLKQVIPASQFTGGKGRRDFRSVEQLWAGTGQRAEWQSSTTRNVITLAGGEADAAERSAVCRFDDVASSQASAEEVRQVIVRISGMWDFQAEMPGQWATLHRQLPIVGRFRVTLNGQALYEGEVLFWNYRQWRFWPSWEVEAPAALLRPSGNELRVENLTRSLLDHIPATLRRIYTDAALDRARAELPERLWGNTTFHMSRVQLVARRFHDLEVLSVPTVAHVGEPFVAELFAVRPHRLEVLDANGVDVCSTLELHPGRQPIRLVATQAGARRSVQLRCRDTGRTIRIEVAQAVDAPPGAMFHLGHIIGGHLSAMTPTHHYQREVELFRDTGQGDLVCWLANPLKAGDYITLERLPVEDLHRYGLKAAFRFNDDPGMPYRQELVRIAEALGERLLGVGAHEYGGWMGATLRQTPNRREVYKQFCAEMQRQLNNIRAIVNGAGVWVTDPSLYTDIYQPMGVLMPGIELFPLQCNINIASARGTARMAGGETGFAVIDSFECQAFGGLAMPEPFAEQDPRFDEKRGHLWWLSLFHSYLAGGRVIYSESGPFHHVVGRQWDFEDAALADMRRSQRELWRFGRFHALRGLPAAGFAFVKSPDDIFSDSYAPPLDQTTAADLTWSRLRVAWPNARFRNLRLEGIDDDGATHPDYADTPLGEADVVTADAPLTGLQQYRALVLVGTHAVSHKQVETLRVYAEAGGQVVLAHYDLLDQPQPNAESNARLERLCGVRCCEPYEDGFLWELDVVAPMFAEAVGRYVRENHASQGLCGAFLPSLVMSSNVEVKLRDALTHRPLLVRFPIGKGAVWLLNVVNYPESFVYQRLANAIVRTILEGVDRPPIYLEPSRRISVFHYPADQPDQEADAVFLLNTDWFTTRTEGVARLMVHGKVIDVPVPRRSVRVVYATTRFALIPDRAWLRVSKCVRTGEHQWRVSVQCDEGISLSVLGYEGAWRVQRLNAEGGVARASERQHHVVLGDAGIHELQISFDSNLV